MSFGRQFLCAALGWLGGVAGVTMVGLVLLPAVIGSLGGRGSPAQNILFGLVLLIASVPALAGGFLGGRLAREGGGGGQLIMAALVGAVFAIPLSCIGFWYLGW